METMTATAKAIWDEKEKAWRVHVEWHNEWPGCSGNTCTGDYLVAMGDEAVIPLALCELLGVEHELYDGERLEKIS